MQKKTFFKIWKISAIIGFFGVIYWFSAEVPSPKRSLEEVIDVYKAKEFSGIVTKRYIDVKEHGYHKIILNDNGKEEVVILDWEKGGLFNLIEVGDTLNKESGKLNIHLKREGLDTIINMQFSAR
jgi:hypothetical protein